MTLPARPRYRFIEKVVNSILDGLHIERPPVPVEDIIKAHGVIIRYSDLDDVSGLVVRAGGQTVIGVNRTHSSTRRRFTLAHEFGHVQLHAGREIMFDKEFRYNLRSDLSGMGVDVEEIEANFFAACLLMPRRIMDCDKKTHSIEIEDPRALRELSREYGVSPQAMALRLANVARRTSPTSQTRLPF
jgi:Zn-dependent peptidase ImmA (M78 family)